MIARLFEHPASLLVLILLIVVLFGWKQLPDMARSVGRSTRILKSEVDALKDESKQRQETLEGNNAVVKTESDKVVTDSSTTYNQTPPSPTNH